MGFRFRLTFSSVTPGFFRFDEDSKEFNLGDLEMTLTARDADKLSQASRFDIEACGFANAEAARENGERLRLRLRLFNSMLDSE